MKHEQQGSNDNPEVFSIATLLYTRLRRVQGRVIDVAYFIESKIYAKLILDLAKQTQDEDLCRYAERLEQLMDFSPAIEIPVLQEEVVQPEPAPVVKKNDYQSDAEITEEDIYKAQVSHHYIGALR